MNVKDIIRKNRERDGANIDWRSLAETVAREIISEKFMEIKSEIKIEFGKIINEITKDLTPEKLKGEKGDKPKAGVDYLIPKAEPGKPGEPGHTPTEDELLALIESVMPEIHHGKDAEPPSDSRLLKLIRPLVPNKKGLLALIKPLIDAFEVKFDKKLANFFVEVKRMIRERGGGSARGGGGGMGTLITQTTSISSATTTISLDYNVSSNGKAIWFNYQGQQQAYGTHFTVSGKTITLLFTPQDGTFADIIYLRT